MRLYTLAVALVAAFGMSPASANWFDAIQAGANHKKLPGSASSPTPDDLRALGDSKLGKDKIYTYNERDGHWHEVRSSVDNQAPAAPVPPPASASAKTQTSSAASTAAH